MDDTRGNGFLCVCATCLAKASKLGPTKLIAVELGCETCVEEAAVMTSCRASLTAWAQWNNSWYRVSSGESQDI